MREKYAPAIKLYCMITNTDMVLNSIKYNLQIIRFNPTSTTFTVRIRIIQQKSSKPFTKLNLLVVSQSVTEKISFYLIQILVYFQRASNTTGSRR